MMYTKSYVALACFLVLGSQTILCESKRTVTKNEFEPPTWKIIDDEAYCGKDVRKDLSDVASVEECQSAAFADPDCGDQLHTNGQLCRCVKLGSDCDFVSSKAGSAVYQKVIRTVDVTWATNSPGWKAAKARCCCNKKKSWKDTMRLRSMTGICVIVKNTDTCSKAATAFKIDELKRKVLHTHEDVEDGLCEIPEAHVQQVVDDFGPIGCAASDLDEHGYKVEFTKLGGNALVVCPRGQRSHQAAVTCDSNGLFTPTPECHGE